MATTRHLCIRNLIIFGDLQFRLTFQMLPVRACFWFFYDVHPDIDLCTHLACGAVESDQYLFVDRIHTAQSWKELLPTWEHFTRTRWMNISCAIVPTIPMRWKVFRELSPTYGLHCRHWRCASSGPTDQWHRQYQRYPWCILRSVRMFGIKALFENEIQIWWSICIWIIDGSTSMRNLQHYVKSPESFFKAQLEIHCNKHELQRTNESDTATYADSVTIETNAFRYLNCWINSERKDHPVLF